MSETTSNCGVVIVDDEQPARRLLREYLDPRTDFEVLAECANGFEAVKAVDELRPEILLLDVQMPKLDGFEVLELIRHQPHVIFTTAHDEYALKAFEVHAVDYLLKPFSQERLHEALDRALERLAGGERQPLQRIAEARRDKLGALDRILVREGSRVHVVPCAGIDYVEAQDDYVQIRAGELTLRKKQTLTELERSLNPKTFVRIHRCYLLNVTRLARIEPYAKDSRVAFLRDGTRLPVSRAGYGRLKEFL